MFLNFTFIGEFPGGLLVRTWHFECGDTVQSLVEELRSCWPWSMAKTTKIHMCKPLWASPVAQWVESAYSAGDLGSIPGSPGEGNGTPLQCSCLENPMDRGAWRATVHGVTQNQVRPSN